MYKQGNSNLFLLISCGTFYKCAAPNSASLLYNFRSQYEL